MNKETLKSILSSEYQPAFWRRVLTEVFGATNLFRDPRPIVLPANELAENSFELGSFETADGRIVGLYQIDLKPNVRIGQNRVGVRSLLRSIYRYDVDAALVVFVQNDKWRLSLISEIRVLDADGDLTEQKTEPKRFTYLLGRGETVRTAVDRLDLYRESDSQLASLIEAFSVEKLNNDFFRDYKVVFDNVVAEVNRSIVDAEAARLFSQSLLNRLMFLYFIQKKGWMTFEGNENYLRSVYDRAIANGENFYRDRLYWIFFYGLSNQAESIEIQTNDFLEERRGNVPYLNGGLFEMESGGNDEKDKVAISNDRFADVLRLFESYNFTIDESTPFEIQVAVDPEMLGKVFEELVTGRHSSGSYYTPRTVVAFMCREALKLALASVDVPDAIEQLVDGNNGEAITKPEDVLKRLAELKVCDPACGSGAYLLGMLQELLHVREAVFASKAVAKDAQYEWKREIIENNIYGVDLDRFATQIAALRLWLSLAIESDEPHPLPNLKYKIGCGDSLLAPIESVGQGDLHRRALIEQFRARKRDYTDADTYPEKAAAEAEIERLRVDIARTLHHLPEPPSPAKLIFAKKHVEPLKAEVTKAVKAGKKKEAESAQKKVDDLLKEIARLEAEQSVSHYDSGDIFDWSVEFAEVFEDGGFDIVIANPPYLRQENLKGIKPLLEQRYEVYNTKADIYTYFYELSYNLLRPGGTAGFITNNTWLRGQFATKLRRLLSNNTRIEIIIDLRDQLRFESALVETSISVFSKRPPDGSHSIVYLEDLPEASCERTLVPQSTLRSESWTLEKPYVLDLKSKVESMGLRLGEWDVNISMGLRTGLNEAFILTEDVASSLITREPKSSRIIEPILRGRDIHRYHYSPPTRKAIVAKYGSNSDIKKNHPVIYEHLSLFAEALRNRGQCRYGGPGNRGMHHWLELDNCPTDKYLQEFKKPKIIWIVLSNESKFTYDEAGLLINNAAFMITGSRLKYLLGVLNSKFARWYFEMICPSSGMGTTKWEKVYVERIPIPKEPGNLEPQIVKLVDEILNQKRLDPGSQTADLEHQVDTLVCRAFALSQREIGLLENHS